MKRINLKQGMRTAQPRSALAGSARVCECAHANFVAIFTDAKNLIEKSENIFILLPEDVWGDNFGAALALFYSLKKLNKNVNLVLREVPEKFKFLPIPEYLNSLKIKKSFVISLDNSKEAISEIHFDKEGSGLKIRFFARNGELTEKDFSFYSQNLTPDLLIILGAQNLEGLGKFFEEKPQIFYEKPILNIDNNLANENFGEINLTNKTSSGVSEIIAEFLKENYENLIDSDIATCLLTGIITATQGFQNQKTSPKNLVISSYLIEKGANNQKIARYLFKTRDFASLKLLGRVLEKLNCNKEKEICWASLAQDDFKKSNTSPKNLGSILEELKVLNPASLLILWETLNSNKSVKGIFYSSQKTLIEKIKDQYESTQKGKGVLFLVKNSDISEAEKEVLEIL